MYSVDKNDHVHELKDVPQASVGAPTPFVIGDEHTILLAYYMEENDKIWDGSYVKINGRETEGEPWAIAKFESSYSHMFGPPNDEAFTGHPLANRGLEPYAVFKIENSSWIRTLEKMNQVHPYHNSDSFKKLNHYIFAFHDNTFECIADSFNIVVTRGSEKSIPLVMTEMLWE
jgi:hypothetical protein